MRRAVLCGALGGAFAGLVLGVGVYVFSDESWFRVGPEAALLLPPFVLAGSLLGGFCAYVVCFGCRELKHFSGVWDRAFREHRRPILWLVPAGALTAVLLAGNVPVPPGLYPFVRQAPDPSPAPRRLEGPWSAVEGLQMTALDRRGDGIDERFQRAAARGFFALLPEIHALSLCVLGATAAFWCALVTALFLVSRRAGGEAVFWSLWLLAAGFFLGIATIGGFAWAFQQWNVESPGELEAGFPDRLFVYSIWNAGVPAAWIIFAAAQSNVACGLLGLNAFWRSAWAALIISANAGAVLVLGTTTRLTLALNLDTPPGVKIVLSYFEGCLVDPRLMVLPAAPLATLGVVIGVGLSLGAASYGMNVTFDDHS